MQSFPIDQLKNQILEALESVDFLVIKSTPGSGKTTRVPLFLREKFSKKIYILEPRKLAAKLASGFVAKSIGEISGKSVGHIFKYEKMVSDNTQIIFLTEGTFLRILASDSKLSDCDVVILDEFHERHYYTDVALSYLLKIKESNKNLKIIIMSATIDLKELDRLLGDRSKTIELNERKHHLSIEHLPNDTLVLKEPLERKVFKAVAENIQNTGHILIFLPGMFEIRRCEEMLMGKFNSEIIILHGELSGVNIDESFEDLNNKKIILSTNIAESSVTIPGVRTVIDSGLHKMSRLNPVTRLSTVELKKISQSSAIQRANRASREADGKAIRLYAELDYQSRDQFDIPEINRVDLSELMISTADIFNSDINQFQFLAPLVPLEVEKSRKYLEQIGLFENGRPTNVAKQLARFPFHPRISKILEEAHKADEHSMNAAINYLAELVEPKSPTRFKHLARSFFATKKNGQTIELEKLMLFGYVDQIAKLKGHQLTHINGETYALSPKVSDQIDPNHTLWIILDLDNRNQVTRLLPIEEEWLYDLPFFPIEENEEIDFDVSSFKLIVERVTKIGAITLSRDKASTTQLSEETINVVTKKLNPLFQQKLNENAFQRLTVLEKYSSKKIADFNFTNWFSGQVLFLLNDRSYSLDVILNSYVKELFDFLDEGNEFDLEKDLPLFLQLHDKRKVEIHYDAQNGIYCESYIQDFYGLSQVPSILKGKEKIKIHLLGPHKRALQVTMDILSFWNKTYKELYGELKRDYPRHYWPISPQTAEPILLLKNVK